MSDFNERDKKLLEKFGMTEEQVSSDVERMESEDAGHGITGLSTTVSTCCRNGTSAWSPSP